MEALAGVFLLATLIEGLITYLFGKVDPQTGESRPWINYIALLLGIGAAIAYKVDIPAMAGLQSAYPFVGYVISGLVIGRGSNYLNDIVSKLRG